MGATVQQELEGSFGFTWVGSIYMGAQKAMDVVFDTGSDWLVVEGSTCVNCDGDTYDIFPAIQSGQARRVSVQSSERKYGSAKLQGREYTDTVCIDLASCVLDFKFFLIERQEGIQEPIDGILGLSRNRPILLNEKTNVGPLYILALSAQETIAQNTFSFYFQQPGLESFIDIGPP